MKTISLSLIFGFTLLLSLNLYANEQPSDRQKKLQEMERLNTELKPLRIRATRDAEVIAARKAADESLRVYYEVLRKKMVELEPKKRSKIERHVRLRKEIYGGSAGSRAEDLMSAAAKEKAAKVSEIKP